MPWCTLSSRESWPSHGRSLTTLVVMVILVTLAAGCRQPRLLEQVEARRLAADVDLQFTKAAEAANRAVMSETDESAKAAVRDTEQATASVVQSVERLQSLLPSLGFDDEMRVLREFTSRFAEFRTLDAEILPLAVENTNLKAQQLSFGRGRDAADEFRKALDAVVRAAGPRDACWADAQAARAGSAIYQIQVLQQPHIAEGDMDAMKRMEAEMATAEAAARKLLEQLKSKLPEAAPQLASAGAALDRFKAIHAEILSLSMRNSDVRSLALSLGRKRTVIAQCDEQLRALQELLAKRSLEATR
jgi:hypothetical protein